jgi:hypothetical protein
VAENPNLGSAEDSWRVEDARLRNLGTDRPALDAESTPRSGARPDDGQAFLSNHREVIAAMDFFSKLEEEFAIEERIRAAFDMSSFNYPLRQTILNR